MKKLLSTACLIVIFFSCQKPFLEDVHPSVGYLIKDVNGTCLKTNVSGTYTSGKKLIDSNYITVAVNITSPGSYLINTDTVNGYSFKANGNFSAIGSYNIKLAGTGKPVAAGVNNFIVRYDTSICIASIKVNDSATSAGTAAYTLLGAPDSCISITVHGNYINGLLTDSSNSITVKVNVTTPGTYNISTNPVNGFSFSGSGVFSGIGIQTITLKAIGKPLNSGINNFTVTAGASSCNFNIDVSLYSDHFPLTKSSYWTYDDLFNPGDTLKRTIIDSTSNVYKIMKERLKYDSSQYLFRKGEDSVYYEYASVEKYTTTVKFSPPIIKEIPFLKEYLTTGTIWTTEEYIGPASFGQLIYIRYEFTCDDANATVTINGHTFTNVYKISMRPQIRSAETYPYNSTGEKRVLYYAKGVGLIYTKFTVQNYTQLEWQIRNWFIK